MVVIAAGLGVATRRWGCVGGRGGGRRCGGRADAWDVQQEEDAREDGIVKLNLGPFGA
jgi:hypothetical protein